MTIFLYGNTPLLSPCYDRNEHTLTGVKHGRLSRGENDRSLMKNLLLKPNFQDEGYLKDNFLNFFLTVYRKCQHF